MHKAKLRWPNRAKRSLLKFRNWRQLQLRIWRQLCSSGSVDCCSTGTGDHGAPVGTGDRCGPAGTGDGCRFMNQWTDWETGWWLAVYNIGGVAAIFDEALEVVKHLTKFICWVHNWLDPSVTRCLAGGQQHRWPSRQHELKKSLIWKTEVQAQQTEQNKGSNKTKLKTSPVFVIAY